LQTELFGKVGLLGSGLDELEKFLLQADQLPEANEIQTNVLQQSIGFGLMMAGTLLRIELERPTSLQHFFGGGYEIAVSERGEFKKLDDVLYAFWSVETDGIKVRGNLLPSRVFRYAYTDDLLRIRSVSFVGSRNATAVREQTFPVPPVYRDVRSHELTDTSRPSLNARWLCNYFLVRFSDGRSEIFIKIAHQPKNKAWIQFEDLAEGVQVAVSQTFLEELARGILGRKGPGK